MNLVCPESWESPTLDELIVHAIGGDWGKAPDEAPSDYVTVGCIRGTEIRNWSQEHGASAATRAIKQSSLEGRRLIEGDILLEVSGGGPEQPVGRTVLIDKQCLSLNDDVPKIPTNFLRLLRPTPEINPPYLNQFLQFFYKTGDVIDYQGGSNNLRNLKFKDYIGITIPLPPLAEQKRIVSKIEELFSELDAGEESLRRARRQLGVYRQSLLKQAFEGKLTEQWRKQNPHLLESPEQLLTRIQTERQAEYAKQLREWEKAKQTHKRASKPSEPKLMDGLAAKEIARIDPPDGWATEKIGNCPTDSLIGLVRAATEQSSDPTGVSYIKMDRVDMLGNVDLSADVFVACTEEEIERFQLRQGDILFNTRNSVELVGKTAVVRRDPTVPTVYNNNLMRIRLPDSLDPTFVGLQMCAKPFRQRMEQVKKATTSVAAIYGKDFWPLGITFPSLPEQCEIVRLLDEQFTVIEQNEREIDAALKRSAALRQSILKKAFTGQLVPQDPTDEPASALLERIRKERDTGSVSKKKTALKKAKPI